MGKYEPLGKFLRAQKLGRINMSFAEIERIINSKLPPSKKYPAWWSNNPDNNVMTREWLEAGYETESVDPTSEKLVFRRSESNMKKTSRKSIMGLMKGMVTLPPDFNPEEPFWELHKEWGDIEIGGLEEKK